PPRSPSRPPPPPALYPPSLHDALPISYQRIVALVPEMYDDIWTGAKGFYKSEPVCADGGEVIIYAPHITEVAAMHPGDVRGVDEDRKSTRLNSSHVSISYAVFCLKKIR